MPPDPLGTTVTISATPQRSGVKTRTGRLQVATVLPAGQATDPVTFASASAVRAAFPGVHEVQTVTITGGPTGGTFTLTFDGQTTGAIAHNATAATVQTALAGLSTIGAGNVTVTGNAGGPYTVTFTGALGGTDVPQMTATASLTGGTSPGVTVATTTTGSTAGRSVGEQLGAAFSTGLAEVTVVRLAGSVTLTSATEADWTTALNKLPAGPAQVIALGATTPAAHAALLAHQAATGKTVFLDLGDLADIAAATAAADLLSGLVGDTRAGIFGNTAAIPQPTGTAMVPASLAAAAVAARGDARRGHAQHAPIWDQAQRPGAGEVQGAVSVARTLSDAHLATLAAHRINPLRVRNGVVELYSFFSLDDDARWSQLNHGRGAMDLQDRLDTAGQQFVGQPLDTVTLQSAETAATDILDDLVVGRAILDDYSVVASADFSARNLILTVECTFIGATERVLITVTVDTSGEVVAA